MGYFNELPNSFSVGPFFRDNGKFCLDNNVRTASLLRASAHARMRSCVALIVKLCMNLGRLDALIKSKYCFENIPAKY